MKKKKRLCSCDKDWEKEYKRLVATNNIKEAKCMICNSTFKIGYVGVVGIKPHKTSDSHKSSCNASASNSSIDKLFVKTNIKEEDNVIASEVTQTYHAVKHNRTHISLDCSSKLNSKLYQDSKLAGKISCGRTKSEAIGTSVSGKKH